MMRLQKLRAKDFMRLSFAFVCILLTFIGVYIALDNLKLAAVACAIVGALILTRKSYRYFWHVMLGTGRKAADWSNYYKE